MAGEWALTTDARDDVADAYSWYESKRPGLGEEVVAAIESCLDSVILMPSMHEVAWKDYRRALVRRFPYAVYYKFNEQQVVVHAIFHTARKPSKWRKRLT
jgi:plasmid stabilization system protein ParE